jgi:hypothetical protein
MRRLRQHVTYANVMSTIAAFMAIGGVGWAAATLPKNSVGTPQIKNDAVTAGKIKRGHVTGGDAKNDTFTGAHIKEATLGQVPKATTAANALKLGGATPATYNIGRAYGYISEGGPLVAARSRNIVNSVRQSTGVYCVTLAPGISLSSIAPVITLDAQFSATTIPPAGNSDDEGIVEWDSVPEDCPAGTLEFDSLKQGFISGSLNSNLRDDQAFTLVIP